MSDPVSESSQSRLQPCPPSLRAEPGRPAGFEGGALGQLYWNEWNPQSRVLLGGAERAGSARRPSGDDEAVVNLSAALEAQLQEYIALPQRYLGDRAEGAAAPAGPFFSLPFLWDPFRGGWM